MHRYLGKKIPKSVHLLPKRPPNINSHFQSSIYQNVCLYGLVRKFANFKTKKNEVLKMKFNYKMVGISLILLSAIAKTEGVLFPIEILDRNQFRCGKTKSKNLCSKSSIERKRRLKEVKDSSKIGELRELTYSAG